MVETASANEWHMFSVSAVLKFVNLETVTF
jgi:hypothetical protein